MGVLGVPRPACARGASPHGYPNVIDITDHRNPKIVAKIKLEVSDNANCELLLDDPPEAGGGAIPGYHEGKMRCRPCQQSDNARLRVWSMQACAFSTFGMYTDPKEIAYYKPPALRTAFLPGSISLDAGRRSNHGSDSGLPALCQGSCQRGARA